MSPRESAERSYREALARGLDVTQRAIAGRTPEVEEILATAHAVERAGSLCQVVADMGGPSEATMRHRSEVLFSVANDLRLAAAMYLRQQGALPEVEA